MWPAHIPFPPEIADEDVNELVVIYRRPGGEGGFVFESITEDLSGKSPGTGSRDRRSRKREGNTITTGV